MTQDFGADLEELGRVIDTAEVFMVRFERGETRLLVDARTADGDPPRIGVVPRVSSAAERYRYLKESRPGVPLPEHITVFRWVRPIDVMRESGIWQRIEDRLVAVGGPEMQPACNNALEDVRARERAEMTAVILGGEGFETLWRRSAP